MIRKKKNLISYIIILIAGLGIGYAFLTTTLNIDGITDIDSNSWNVYWDNVQVKNGSVSGTQVIQAPTIGATGTSLSYEIRLSKPGDYYEFTIDAKNAGTLDAMIESVSSKLNGTPITSLPNYFDFSITYGEGLELLENHYLKANSLERYRIRVEFIKDISNTDLPSEFQNLTIEINVSYVQSDDNAVRVRNYYYSTPTDFLTNGSNVPNNVEVFETPYDSITSSNHEMFVAITFDNNNKVSNSLLGFVYNDKIYYLKSGGATYDSANDIYNYDSIYFNENKAVLLSAFGNICEELSTDISCEKGKYHIYVSKNGYIEVSDDSNYNSEPYCYVTESGEAKCENL